MSRTLSDGQIVAFVTVLIAVSQFSTSIYLPSLPALVEIFETDAAMVQMTFTVYMAGAAISQLVIGPLSDRFGRRPVLFAGIVIYILASIVAAMAPTVEALIAARLVQSIGATTGPVIGRAIVRDRFDRSQGARVMANVGLAIAVSPALAPLLGAYVHEAFGWRANFILVAAFGLLIGTLAVLWLEETNRNRQHGASFAKLAANYGRLLRSREFLVYAMTSSLVFGSMFAFLSEAPFVFMNLLGTTEKEYAVWSGVPVLGFAAGSLLASRYGMAIGLDRMIQLGLGAAVVGGAAMLALALGGVLNVLAIILPVTLVVLAMGLVFPNATSAALGAHPEIAGTGSALLGFLQMGTGGLSIFGTSLLTDGTQMPMVWFMAATGISGALVYASRYIGRRARAAPAE